MFWHFAMTAVRFDMCNRHFKSSLEIMSLRHLYIFVFFSPFSLVFHSRHFTTTLLRCDYVDDGCDVDVCLFFDFGCRSDFSVNDRTTFEHFISLALTFYQHFGIWVRDSISVRRKKIYLNQRSIFVLDFFFPANCMLFSAFLNWFFLFRTPYGQYFIEARDQSRKKETGEKMPRSESSHHSFDEEIESFINGMIWKWVNCSFIKFLC